MSNKDKIIINDIDTFISTINDMCIPFDKMFENMCGIKWNPNAISFYDMDLDELDVIGVVIEIEKEYKLIISDYLVDLLLKTKPHSIIVGQKRNNILDDLGI
jgi:hypothetical protein